MKRLGAVTLTAGLLLMLTTQVAFARPVVDPEVEADCGAGTTTVWLELDANEFVVISDGDGFSQQFDGPMQGTVELQTVEFQWAAFGVDDSGVVRDKGEGEFTAGPCDEETTTTTVKGTTTTTAAPTTTVTTEATTTTAQPTTTTTVPETPDTSQVGIQPTTTTSTTIPPEVSPTAVEASDTTVAPVVSPETLPFTGPATAAGLGLAGAGSVLFGLVTLVAARKQRRT